MGEKKIRSSIFAKKLESCADPLSGANASERSRKISSRIKFLEIVEAQDLAVRGPTVWKFQLTQRKIVRVSSGVVHLTFCVLGRLTKFSGESDELKRASRGPEAKRSVGEEDEKGSGRYFRGASEDVRPGCHEEQFGSVIAATGQIEFPYVLPRVLLNKPTAAAIKDWIKVNMCSQV